ncbi:tellurite resistance TerB family protein [Saccharospirillum impatiens]|uniref:tellurite resistance TerB family protein n=1 Tax=Saccharospirillum impatiens TaxID=169438 RepID=UPI0004197470|nr:tellurite resistance TerB family protein [Saccharospirillum impatiens]
MITRGLIDQLMKSGSDLMQNPSVGQAKTAATDKASQLSGLLGGNAGSLLSGAGGGLLAGGALGMLLGNKKLRKTGGKLAMYGGVAALGAVAFKAYQNYQQKQSSAPQGTPETLDRLPDAQAEQHSQAILRAVIGAAKADGHVDDKERALIDGEIAKLSGDAELTDWFDRELRKPLDPTDIASSAKTPEMGAEMYLASLLVVDEQNYMEKAYLTELARQLKLDPVLVTELESQVVGVS